MSDIVTQLTEAKALLAAALALLEKIDASPNEVNEGPLRACQNCRHEDVDCEQFPCNVCELPDDQWEPKE